MSDRHPAYRARDTPHMDSVGLQINEEEAAFDLTTPEEMTKLEELTVALTTAQIPYDLFDDEETGEVVLTWPQQYSDEVTSMMEAFGVDLSVVESQVPNGGEPVKPVPKQKKQSKMLASLSRKTQLDHAKGRAPMPSYPLAMEAINKAMQGDTVKDLINSVMNKNG